MAEKNDSGDKTEKPTPKRLLDARKKGDVPKSRELTSTLTLLVWLGLGASALPLVGERIAALLTGMLDSLHKPFELAAPVMGWMAVEVVLWVTALLLGPVVLVGCVTEFLQTGPVCTFEKMRPRLDALNPVRGIQKMFSMDNLFEVLKALAKTIVLFWIGWAVIKSLLPQIALLPTAPPALIGTAIWQITARLLGWTLGAFALVSVLDLAWQRHRFTQKMRMSLRDIKQEMKESEGDPHIKAQRKQTHHEWSQRNSAQAAAAANVLVVNPTHVAIAIDYDRDHCPVPTLSAKGEGDLAVAMREAAEAAGVPIVRNVSLARGLLVRAEVGELVPQDFFDAMAEVILWARQVRADLAAQAEPLRSASAATARHAAADAAPRKHRRSVPGEDMTRYPESFRRHDDS